MDKPNRHRTHILETESSKFFNNYVPNEWIVDKPDHDYGLDYNVNIVINNNVTGLNFSVQLKSTKKNNLKGSISITLKHSTLGMFNTRLEPVLLVVYVQEEKEAYFQWYNELTIDLTSSQKTFKIGIPQTNRLSIINWENIVKYVQSTFSIKTLFNGIKSLEYKEISDSEILAWRYYYSRDYERAIFYLKNLLREDPKKIIVLEGLAYCQYMSYKYKEALLSINEAIELSGKPIQYLTKACILAEDGIQNNIKGKVIEAKNIFRKFIKKNPNQDIYHYNFANSLSHLGETKEALKHYKVCLKLNPNYAEAWKNLGQVYFELHQHVNELSCYNKALTIIPNLPQALFSKGITLSYVYNQDKEGLSLMIKSLENEKELLQNFSRGYFWLAYTNEKLKNLKESLKWINKGLDQYPGNVYFLNFKSNLLASNWKENNWLKAEAIHFFEYRLELENDYKSLYFLIEIKDIAKRQKTFELIKTKTHIFNDTTLSKLKKCNIKIEEAMTFLIHYDKYLKLRHTHPINRYIDHLIFNLYSISSEFLEILDLVFATCFSNAISGYLIDKDTDQLSIRILDGLFLAAKTIPELIPDYKFLQKDSISIMTQIILQFPVIIIREYGVQLGYISGSMGLRKPNIKIDKQWLDDFREQTILITNERLKLFKNEE